MPDAITTAFVQQYAANVELLMQQKTALLVPNVWTGGHKGKKASIIEQFGEATAQQKTTRNSDTPLLDLSQAKRWVTPSDWEWASLIDEQDKLRMIIDPTSPYAMAAAAAMNRAKDDLIINAFFASADTGEDGSTAEAFGTLDSGAYDVARATGGSNNLLNVPKLQNVVKLLITYNKGELDDAVYGAISANEHDSLLKEVQIVNKDYGNSAVLVDGRIKRFMGIDFTITQRLLLDSTATYRILPFWRKTGMYLGVWEDTVTQVTPRPDKSYATQVYMRMTMGATRTQLGKVIRANVAK